MGPRDSTCWTLLHEAAAGGEAARAEFAARYAVVVRAYLAARWRGAGHLQDLDDTVQDVFVECLREGGVLERARSNTPGGFRAYLFGAVRHVAHRAEARRARLFIREQAESADLDAIPDGDDTLSKVFDRAWAKAVMRDAAERQAVVAANRGEAAERRVEL